MPDWADLLVNPTVDDKAALDTRLALRRSLDGELIALVDNGKANGGLILSLIADELTRRCGVRGVRTFIKDDAGTTLEPSVLSTVSADCAAAVSAIGDCGSCSAATLADTILLERAGVPAVGICSDAFRMSADAIADSYGFPGFDYVALQHPLASLDRDAVETRVAAVMPHVLSILGVAE